MEIFNHVSGDFIKVDDAEIYYEELGSKCDQALLLLHGGLNTIEMFNPFLAIFPKRYRVLGIDCRGHGRSTLGAKELSYALLQIDVERILKKLKIDNLNILGFSNGGTIAYRLAAYTDIKINKMMTVGSPWNLKYLEHVIDIFSALSIDDWKKQCPDDNKQYQRLNPDNSIECLFDQAIKMGIDKSDNGCPNDCVKNITCDVLAVRGEYDPIVTDQSLIEFKKIVKHAQTLSVEGATHEIFNEKPDSLVKTAVEFFA